jgi:hypothetical protein
VCVSVCVFFFLFSFFFLFLFFFVCNSLSSRFLSFLFFPFSFLSFPPFSLVLPCSFKWTKQNRRPVAARNMKGIAAWSSRDCTSPGARDCPSGVKRTDTVGLQDDLLYESLTVWEVLYYAAMLRLPRTMSVQEKKDRVLTVIKALGILSCKDTIIGACSQYLLRGNYCLGCCLVDRDCLFRHPPLQGSLVGDLDIVYWVEIVYFDTQHSREAWWGSRIFHVG